MISKLNKSSCGSLFTGTLLLIQNFALIIFATLLFKFSFIENKIIISILYFFVVFFIGTRMRYFGNIIHECSHAKFVPTYKHNIMIGRILAALEMSSFSIYRKNHAAHHRFLGELNKDPDCALRLRIGVFKSDIFSFKKFVSVILNPYNWVLYLKESFNFKFESYLDYFIIFVYLILISIYVKLLGFNTFVLFIVVPYFTTYQIMKIFSDIFDHGGIYFANNAKDRTRNHLFQFMPFNWILFPYNDTFHLLHHMYPRIPSSELYKVHNILLMESKEYNLKKHLILWN